MKCLQKDILDFQEYTKDQIKRNKIVLDELLKFIQTTVNECIPEYEVRLYGSHATNLCLPWSDLDIVLINRRTGYSNEYRVLQQLYVALLDKQWKKSIKFIDTALIPLIKIHATDEYNNMQMDISLQDGKHYGIKCVDLVKRFMTEYEALEPLLFVLKNLLKNANLNDPYTGGLSSYGLILMVVSYLQSQIESNKSIKITDGNLGRLFMEFLCYYGIIFDHTKYVIYTYPPSDGSYDKDQNSLFLVYIY
jgi:non-canonical poly(A) RNA polymerase PAPD5/7